MVDPGFGLGGFGGCAFLVGMSMREVLLLGKMRAG